MQTENTVLVIMDGIGYSTRAEGNAVYAANMKNHKKIIAEGASCLIEASGERVGLQIGAYGNSEVGHNALGDGQHTKQSLALLNDQIATGEIFKMPTYLKLLKNAEKKGNKLNIIMLLSDGRNHSNIDHLFPFLKDINKYNKNIKISIHALLDGRDVFGQSGYKYIKQTLDFISKNKINASISTVGGRGVILMDRYESNTAWVTNGFKAIVDGVGAATNNIEKSLNDFYKNNPELTDQEFPPHILNKNGLIKNGDSVLLLNYRADRALEMCRMFDHGKYISAEDYKKIDKCFFAGILQYDAETDCPHNYISEPPKITNTLTEYLGDLGLKQYTVTEAVKYGHLTYYFNGNTTKKYHENLEVYKRFESDKVIYSQKPKMQAKKITNCVVDAIKSGEYKFIKCNLANGDMVGHTGNFKAAVIACKEVDKCLGKIYKACKKYKTNLIVVADHGNADVMVDENGKIVSSHTANPVWFSAINFASSPFKLNEGEWDLTNVTASIATSLNIKPNKVWEKSIISR